MPPLKNGRQEIFAQELAKGSTQIAAHQAAGYQPDDGNASRLTGKNRVKQRIAEIQQGAIERVQVTVGDLVSAANEIRSLAIRDKQYSAAVGAVKEIGILTGLRIDRREVGRPGEFERMSDEELEAWIASETAKLIELPDDEVGDRVIEQHADEHGHPRPASAVRDPAARKTKVPTVVPAKVYPATLEDRLRPLGLSAAMENDVLVVKSTNGLRCEYSARYFVPVAFPGLEGVTISARLITPGCAEVRIGGECYSVTSSWTPDIDLPASE
jgi:hypothetical protein